MFVHYNQLVREKEGRFSKEGLKWTFLEPETYVASSISAIDTEQMKETGFRFSRGHKGNSKIILPSCQHRAYTYEGPTISREEFTKTVNSRDNLEVKLQQAMRLIGKTAMNAELYDMTGAIQVKSSFKGGDGSRLWYPIIRYHHWGDTFFLEAIYKPEEPELTWVDELML